MLNELSIGRRDHPLDQEHTHTAGLFVTRCRKWNAIVIHRDRRMALVIAANCYLDVTSLPFFESVFDSVGREFVHYEREGGDMLL